MRLKVAAVVVLLAVGVGTVGWALFAPNGTGTQVQYLTATVTRTTVAQQVVATGSAQAAQTYDLAFGSDPTIAGASSSTTGSGAGTWLVDSVNVAVGDHVAKGDVLAVADTASAAGDVETAKANLAVAKARLAVDKGGLTGAERAAAFDSIRQAQQQLAVARQSQRQTTAQDDLKLAQAKAALADAQEQLVTDQTAGPESATLSADQAAVTQAQQQVDTITLQVSSAQADAGITNQQNQLKLSQAQSALAAAQARLAADQAADPPVPEAVSADQASISQAQQALDTITLQIQASTTQASSTGQQNQLKLTQAQAALATAQQKLAADQAAGPSTATIKNDQSAIDQAQAQLDSLVLSLAASSTSAANQLTSAELSLSSSQHNYATKTAPATASTIATDSASVTAARLAVEDAQRKLDGARLTSPIDGVIVAVNVVAGTSAPSSADLTVATLQMDVTATVTETDLPSLAVGQAVTVEITATGKSATGRVKQISPVADSTDAGSVVTYPIVVALDSPPAGTASGMTAEVQVTTAEATNVLAVPAEALNGSAGNYSVSVLGADGQPTPTSVRVGLVTNTLAEVANGLAEGETVVTGINAPQTGTATTTGAGFGPGLGGGGAFPVGGGTFQRRGNGN